MVYYKGVFWCAQLGLEEDQPQPRGWVVPDDLTTSGYIQAIVARDHWEVSSVLAKPGAPINTQALKNKTIK